MNASELLSTAPLMSYRAIFLNLIRFFFCEVFNQKVFPSSCYVQKVFRISRLSFVEDMPSFLYKKKYLKSVYGNKWNNSFSFLFDILGWTSVIKIYEWSLYCARYAFTVQCHPPSMPDHSQARTSENSLSLPNQQSWRLSKVTRIILLLSPSYIWPSHVSLFLSTPWAC